MSNAQRSTSGPILWFRGTRPARARRTMLWGAVAFLALQLGLALAIEFWLPELRDPAYGYKICRLQNYPAIKAGRPFTVLMLGSSRTAFGLRAGDLEDHFARELGRPVAAFNFGVPAAGPITELLLFRRLLAHGIRPDFLLIEVLPPLLDSKSYLPGEAASLPPTRLWLEEVAVLGRYHFPTGKLRRAWWRALLVPWFSHRFAILSRVAPALLPIQLRQDWTQGTDPSGWSPFPFRARTPQQQRRAAEETLKPYATYLTDFRLGGPTCQALRELLERCRRERIPRALVLMPEGLAFRRSYTPQAWAQIRTFLAELSRTYHAPLINAQQWLGEDNFYDAHHLLRDGATAFTQRLGQETVPLLLQQTGARQYAAGGSPRTDRRN